MTQSQTPFTFDEMMQMFIHWDEQSRAMFTDAEYRDILDCLNDLVAEFGRSWVEKLAGVRKTTDPQIKGLTANDNIGDGCRGIIRAVHFHEDWDIVRRCPNAQKLNAKLSSSHDSHHVDLEIHVAAAFARCDAVLELEPELASGKSADFRVKLEDGSWLYAEVSKRDSKESKIVRQIERATQTLLDLALKIATGRRCYLHIFKKFEEDSFKKMVDWLSKLEGSQTQHDVLNGIAEFRSFAHDHDDTTEILISRSPPVVFKQDGDIASSTFGTIYYYVPDVGFKEKFEDEREQIPTDGLGVIFLDVTDVAGGLSFWHDEAIRELALPENAHVLGVVLLSKCIDGTSYPRWKFQSAFAINPTISVPPRGSLELVRRAFAMSETEVDQSM